MDEPRMACDTEAGRIWLDGLGDELNCYDGNYNWTDIEVFLAKLEQFCRQSDGAE